MTRFASITHHLFIIVILLFSAPSFAEPNSRLIGVSVALSGPLAPVGKTLRNALELADSKYDLKDQVSFIFEDDGFQPKNTVTIVNKFLDRDKVDAVIVFGASTSLSVAPLTEKQGIPLIGLTVLEKLEAGKKSTFRFFASTKSMSDLTIKEMKHRGYKKIAVVATMQDATLLQRDHFIDSTDLEVVINEELLPADLDFRSITTKIKASGADATYIITLPPQGSNFAKQLRQIGYNGSIVTSLQVGAPSEIENGGDALKGSWFVSGDDSHAVEFYKEYELKFSNEPAFSETVYGFDLAKLLIEATSDSPLVAYLHNVKNFNGALGTYSSDGKGSFDFTVRVKEIN